MIPINAQFLDSHSFEITDVVMTIECIDKRPSSDGLFHNLKGKEVEVPINEVLFDHPDPWNHTILWYLTKRGYNPHYYGYQIKSISFKANDNVVESKFHQVYLCKKDAIKQLEFIISHLKVTVFNLFPLEFSDNYYKFYAEHYQEYNSL